MWHNLTIQLSSTTNLNKTVRNLGVVFDDQLAFIFLDLPVFQQNQTNHYKLCIELMRATLCLTLATKKFLNVYSFILKEWQPYIQTQLTVLKRFNTLIIYLCIFHKESQTSLDWQEDDFDFDAIFGWTISWYKKSNRSVTQT